MSLSLRDCPNLQFFGGMAASLLLFSVSCLALIFLLGYALISLFFAFADVRHGIIAAWAWIALVVAAWHVVRSIEMINAPDWKALGFATLRSILIIIAYPRFWLTFEGIV